MSLPERIVEALLESDEVDPKQFIDRNSSRMFDTWVQVDGDMDWWDHGGTFHNEQQGMLVHLPGLEGDEMKDWSSWDIELSPDDLAAINAQFPENIDPEWPEGGDENERPREDAVENRKQEIADLKNANRKMRVYRWSDDYLEDYSDHFAEIMNQTGMDEEEFAALPLGAKWAQLGSIIGYYEFDDNPDRYTEAEIKEYLKPLDDFRASERRRHSLPEEP